MCCYFQLCVRSLKSFIDYRALLTVGSIGLVFTEPGWKCVGMF